MSKRLAGQRLLITGGASGIGLEVARQALAQGARVALLDRRREALAEAVSALGPDAHALACDVTDSAAVNQAVADAAQFLGGLDNLVNSAGIDLIATLDQITDDAWLRLFDVNLNGPMRVSRAALPWLKQSAAPAIVNIASGAGLAPLPQRSGYCATKAGLIMFGKALAMELAPYGIRVNTVCPGAVDTPLFRDNHDHGADAEAVLQRIRARYALGRIATADEIAGMILFLCGPQASYITGTAIAVDGGRTFH